MRKLTKKLARLILRESELHRLAEVRAARRVLGAAEACRRLRAWENGERR